MSTYDAIVIGGGPGGLYAAERLAGAGFGVALFEEHQAIGEPVHCTGVLAREALEEFGLTHGAVLNAVSTARFYSPSGRSIAYTTREVEALVIDRCAFDRDLAEDAEAAGARLFRQHRVTNLQIEPDAVTADVSGIGQVHARAGILACGANYTFQRRLGLGMPSVFLQSAQMELPAERLGDVELHFGADIAPRGFAWAVPVRRPSGNHVRVGVMCDRDAAIGFRKIVGRVAPRWGVDAAPSCRPRQKMLPLSPIAKTYTDRLLVIGDAAGLVKATTGGGIYYSIVSASLAADVLADALDRDDLSAAALQAYELGWQRRLSRELQAQLSLRLIAQRMTDQEIEGLFELAQTNGVMPIVRRTASFNRHRNLILALFKHPPVRQILLGRLAS